MLLLFAGCWILPHFLPGVLKIHSSPKLPCPFSHHQYETLFAEERFPLKEELSLSINAILKFLIYVQILCIGHFNVYETEGNHFRTLYILDLAPAFLKECGEATTI